MNVLEIAANMVRNAVDTMSSKFSAFVKNEINAKVSTLYKPGGAATLATLPALTADNAGYVYDMSEVFTTTASFREGAGHKYPAGTNVVVSDVGDGVYKYDVLSGMLDGYVQESRKVGNVPLSADIPVTLTGDTAITVTNTETASAIGYSVTHNDSGVTAGNKGDTTNQTPGFGGTFKVLSATVDAKGHVTALGEHTAKIPDTEATQNAKGLMSAEDKTKLDTLIDATLSNEGKAADAKAAGDKISELKAKNALFREYFANMEVYRTASGNPATFSDAKAANVKALSVTMTPTQSGSGHPYPPGSGKNLFDISAVTSTNEVEVTNADLTTGTAVLKALVTANTYGDARYTTTLEAGTYTLSGTVSGSASGATPRVMIARTSDGNTVAVITNTSSSFSFTLSAKTEVLMIVRLNQSNSISIGDICTVSNVMLRFSDTDPTFAPYSNIRPISGVSSVSVTRRNGKNLFDPSFLLQAAGWSVDVSGVYSGRVGALAPLFGFGIGYPVGFPFKPNTRYTFSADVKVTPDSPNTNVLLIQFFYTDGERSDVLRVNATEFTHFSGTSTSGKDISYLSVSFANNGTAHIKNIQLEESTTETAYEPYQGQTVTVQLTDGSNPLTVYGGTLDVTTGELTVTHRRVELSNIFWNTVAFNSENYSPARIYFSTAVNDMWLNSVKVGTRYYGEGVSNCFSFVAENISDGVPGKFSLWYDTSYNGYRLFVSAPNCADASQFKQWVTDIGAYVVYRLAEPLTYQLSPAQLATLSGYNAISTDAASVSVTYKADPSITLGGG